MNILLTHSPETLKNYYGDRALSALQSSGEVKRHGGTEPLEGEALIGAAEDCDLIVSYRQSPGPAALFERLPKLKPSCAARSTSATSIWQRRARQACW